ncbi:hypothetical protein PHJA_002637900, partial [Phtheirospermum japonicum]
TPSHSQTLHPLLPLLPRLSLSATTAPIPNHHRRTRSYPLGPQDVTRILLLRCLPPAPAQQDPRPEAPPDLDHPRLGSQGHRLLRVLRRPEEARALIQWSRSFCIGPGSGRRSPR